MALKFISYIKENVLRRWLNLAPLEAQKSQKVIREPIRRLERKYRWMSIFRQSVRLSQITPTGLRPVASDQHDQWLLIFRQSLRIPELNRM